MLFLFRGGILFEIEWAETGLGRALPFKGKACCSKCRMQNTNAIWCLVSIFSLVVVQGTGCHPRHPPRAFPLGLLAPRCLCAVLFLASAPCSALARAPLHLGGERNPPPSFGLLLVPSESALAQPPSSFSYRLFVVSLSLLGFCIARLRRRSSFSHGRPSGNVRGSNTSCLPQRVRVRTRFAHPCAHERHSLYL